MPEWYPDNRAFGSLAEGLREVGFAEEEVFGILGNNWARFFAESFSTKTEDVT
jgi:microsomal dipeptidase-like Zn-dependent dipeptidase